MKKLTAFDLKILITLYLLNNNDDYALSSGIYKLLKGIKDEDTFKYVGLPTFGTLISTTQKKVTCRCNALLKLNLLTKFYIKDLNDFYYRLSNEGYSYVESYLDTHKLKMKQKEFKPKKSIVHFEDFSIKK